MKNDELKSYVNNLWDEGRRGYSDLRAHEKEIIASVDLVESEVNALLERQSELEAENEREAVRAYRGRRELSETDLMIASYNAEVARNCNSSLRSVY